MGSAKSRARSLPSDDEVEDHNTKTCCWTGIRKFFSKSKQPNSTALQMMEDDIDNDDDDDDNVGFTLVNDPSNSSTATTIEPRALHKSWSAPALLGRQECKQAPEAALSSKVDDELPSTSYPKDVRVSSQYFLSFHRFVNDEENDNDSVSSDVEYGEKDDDDNDADVESNADDITTSVIELVYSEDEYTDNDCSVEQEDEDEIKDSIEESDENETRQTVMVKKYDHDQMIKVKVINQTDENISSYLSSDDDDDDDCLDEIEVMFVISLIWTFIRNAFSGVYQAGLKFVHDIVKGEESEEDEMDVDEKGAVVGLGETGDHTPSGGPETYFPFTFYFYIRDIFHGVYRTGLQFVQDVVMGEDEQDDDGTDIDQGWTIVGTEEIGDRTHSGSPERCSDLAYRFLTFVHDIKFGVSQFFYDIVKELGGAVVGSVETGDRTPHQGWLRR